MLVQRATISYTLNLNTVGVPYIMGADETQIRPPVLAPFGPALDYRFEAEPAWDFFIDAINVQLWHIEGAPGARTITFVNPDPQGGAGLEAPVFIRFYELFHGAGGSQLQTESFRWQEIAANAQTPQSLGLPTYIPAGTTLVAEITNQSGAGNSFAVTIQLIGRQRKPRQAYLGRSVPQYPAAVAHLYERLKRADALREGMVGPNNDENLARVGVPVAYALDNQPIRLAAGNFDVAIPGAAVITGRARFHASYYSFVRFMTAAVRDVDNALDFNAFNSLPVFVRLYDYNRNLYMTSGFVPLMAAFSPWAGLPNELPVDWALPRGAIVEIEMVNMFGQAVDVAYSLHGFHQFAPIPQIS